MKDLNLLIELQNYDLKIKEMRDELKKIEEDSKAEEIRNETSILVNRKEELDKENEVIKEELTDLNRKLKDNYFNIEEIDKNLYDGSITDIKQLDHMNEELISLKKETGKLESETIIVMEKQEIIEDELEKLSKRLSELDLSISEIRDMKSEKTNKYNEDIEKISQKRLALIDKLDDDSLKEYKSISSSKIDFLAKIDGDKCTGCNMILPIFLLSKVNENSLVKCENCNRILYKE